MCSSMHKPELALFMVDHHVVWFDISVHNTVRVTVIQTLFESNNAFCSVTRELYIAVNVSWRKSTFSNSYI